MGFEISECHRLFFHVWKTMRNTLCVNQRLCMKMHGHIFVCTQKKERGYDRDKGNPDVGRTFESGSV